MQRKCKGMKRKIKNAGRVLAGWLYPMATYCVCCGNLIDQSRSYCLCDHCIRRIEWGWLTVDLAAQAEESGRANHLDSAVACITYGLYGRRLIFDLKYNKHTYTARIIADILADRLLSDPDATYLLDADLLVPVPLHAKRLAQRGFNQTSKIARHLATRLRESAETLRDAGRMRDAGREQDAGWMRDAGREQDAVRKQDAVCEPPHYPRLLDGALLRSRETTPQRALSAEERYENLDGAFSIRPGKQPQIAGARILLLDDAYTTGATADQCAKVLKEAGAEEVHLAALATGNHFTSGHFPSANRSEIFVP